LVSTHHSRQVQPGEQAQVGLWWVKRRFAPAGPCVRACTVKRWFPCACVYVQRDAMGRPPCKDTSVALVRSHADGWLLGPGGGIFYFRLRISHSVAGRTFASAVVAFMFFGHRQIGWRTSECPQYCTRRHLGGLFFLSWNDSPHFHGRCRVAASWDSGCLSPGLRLRLRMPSLHQIGWMEVSPDPRCSAMCMFSFRCEYRALTGCPVLAPRWAMTGAW
jgi:hypothetical protein